LPLFCQHIAVISSETATGYGDFCNQLADNPYGFQFQTQLFPAIIQGDGVEQSIIAALEKIYTCNFDAVVIIRGGGATSDLSGFDTLALAENVANFPLPVITGIGHERDESVLDMVSHTRVKTPTAAAAFLISNLKSVLDEIEDCEQRIHAKVKQRMDMEKIRLLNYAQKIPMLFSVVRTRQEALLGQLLVKMRSSIGYRLQDERHRLIVLQNNMQPVLYRKLTDERHLLDLLSQRLIGLDPNRLLKRGYSITLKNGRTVRDVSQLKEGDELETRFENGTVRSVVNQVNNKS
jgi:exodeoxyribonuclease VII large subunit